MADEPKPTSAAQNEEDGHTEPSEVETKEAVQYWGYLFKADKCGTSKLDRLLMGIAKHITTTTDPNDDCTDITPHQLATFYRSVGGNYDSLFLHKPPASIAFIYKSLGCSHSLQPSDLTDPYSPPSVPALKRHGYVTWQTIQLLLEPAEHVPFLQTAVHKFDIIDPDEGRRFPRVLPKEVLPSKPDQDMLTWFESVSERLRHDAQALSRPPWDSADDREYETDERADAARYFDHQMRREREQERKPSRPGTAQRYSREPPRSPMDFIEDRGRGVVNSIRHVFGREERKHGRRREGGGEEGDDEGVGLERRGYRRGSARNSPRREEGLEMGRHARGGSHSMDLRDLKGSGDREREARRASSLRDGRAPHDRMPPPNPTASYSPRPRPAAAPTPSHPSRFPFRPPSPVQTISDSDTSTSTSTAPHPEPTPRPPPRHRSHSPASPDDYFSRPLPSRDERRHSTHGAPASPTIVVPDPDTPAGFHPSDSPIFAKVVSNASSSASNHLHPPEVDGGAPRRSRSPGYVPQGEYGGEGRRRQRVEGKRDYSGGPVYAGRRYEYAEAGRKKGGREREREGGDGRSKEREWERERDRERVREYEMDRERSRLKREGRRAERERERERERDERERDERAYAYEWERERRSRSREERGRSKSGSSSAYSGASAVGVGGRRYPVVGTASSGSGRRRGLLP